MAPTAQNDRRRPAIPDHDLSPGERYWRLFARNLAGVYRATLDGRLLECNEACARIFGFPSPADAVGSPLTEAYFDPAERAVVLEQLQQEGALTNLELRLRRRDGALVWVLANVTLVRGGCGQPAVIEGTLVDVTARRLAEERVLRLNRLYSVTSSLRQAMLHTTDRRQLFDQVCRIAVEKGQFRMAWFGLLDRAAQRVAPVAHAGFEQGYLQVIRISVADEPEGRGPTGSALREGRHFICNDIAGDAAMLPWREEALRRGYGSSAAFPVAVHGRLTGSLNIYAGEPGFFDPENVALLEEMAADIAFALESIEREEQKQQAEQERALALAREEAARAQARAEARFRELLEAAPDAILEIDPTDQIVLSNATTGRLFGYGRHELLGLQVNRLLAERSFPVYERLRAACLAHSERVGAGPEELSARRKDGREFYAEMNLSPVQTDEGGRITCIIRDITERKHLEEQLRQSQKMEALGRLAGGVAHDFNNLLTIIGGYTQMLLSSLKAKNPARRDLESIMEAANRASALTRQLLAFSRRQVVQPKVLDLNRLLTRVHRMLRPVIGEDVELELALQKGLGRVKAGPGQLEQVVMNLVVNARDAMPNGGRITIQTSLSQWGEEGPAPVPLPPGCYVTLAVSDTGQGMDQETLSHMFEPFFTTKVRGKGTGLGLSTVYGIVKQSGGEIEVSSRVGCGSVFRIFLPVFETTVRRVERPRRPAQTGQGAETILLVEDEAGVRQLARQMLLRQGYSVLEAEGGSQALQLWEQHAPSIHLLLTDVVMPQMSGRELAERLKAARPDLKVLYMSGYTSDVIARHGLLDADTALLQKPFTLDGLGRKVRAVLDRGQ
jgi:two-component system cell cycle sensor histidine kinase/response regulator CckA